MVHILYDPVDGAGQLSSFIQRVQVAEMPARLVAGQGVLDVLADCRVDVSSGGLVIPEGCILSIHIFIVKGQLRRVVCRHIGCTHQCCRSRADGYTPDMG